MKLFLLIAISSLCFGLEMRVPADPIRTSIIVPCHPAHFPLLEELLTAYQNQTRLPDEIVISLSQYNQVSPALLLALEGKPWPFALKILKHIAKYPPGRNRNEACAAATGALIICQDADDLPHPQRVEIIRYLFENYQIDHLLHQWLPSMDDFHSMSLKGIENECYTFRVYENISLPNIHNGSVSFLKTLFEKVHWKPILIISEDSIFNRHAYVFCKHKVVLNMPLLKYRGEFSTFDLNGTKGGSLSEN